jgi:phosphoribosyl 1,2-cyclic phosphodiesterase
MERTHEDRTVSSGGTEALVHFAPQPLATKPAIAFTFWGVRGSIPVSNPERTQFGNNTPCIEVRAGNRLLIVDAGSGIVPLGVKLLAEGVRKIDLLLTHLHHDHVMGLFFLKPLYNPDVEVTIYCGNLDGATAEEPLRRLFSPPLFPITFESLAAKVIFKGFKAGETLDLGDGIRVRTRLLNHPSGSTAYRIEHAGSTLSIVTDMEHGTEGPCTKLTEFVRDSDALVYDAMMCPTEYPKCKGWGHSTPDEGVALCKQASVRTLIAFHHHPAYADDKLAQLDAYLGKIMPGSFLAREGQSLELGVRSQG